MCEPLHEPRPGARVVPNPQPPRPTHALRLETSRAPTARLDGWSKTPMRVRQNVPARRVAVAPSRAPGSRQDRLPARHVNQAGRDRIQFYR
jgi:hypothetical protein